MKKMISLVSLLIIFSFTTVNTELTKKERDDALNYCKETKKGVEKEIKGLSENQLNWRPADSVWSAADCVEHIALSEKNIFDMLTGSLQGEANPGRRSELKLDDEAVKKIITDRSFRVKTREGLIKYLKETKDDLRNHFAELPFGLIDSYQIVMFLSGHTKRHTDQIAELKAMPGFPKQ